ncbi:MAG: sporulation protein YunB [Oscillospiraceae bacterium]|nr:sporulation protein YunB [Bacteroidales bacterium]MDD6999402.1 sporulation protein YunB [Oscillospiraceae bacterium]MDY5094853.1 sporulation protein YunB [Oscillospiraceae bacterium]
MQPTLNALAGYECRSSCLEIINQSVQDVLAREPDLCRGLYVYDRNDDGTILAVRADPQAMSRVQLRLTQEVIDRLGARKNRSVQVPVGTLLGWKVLAERGPCISYRYLQDAYVTSSVNSRVSHTGINQTELDVSIAFRATMAALFGNAVTQVEVEHELLLAQILLVGQVPQVYAGV